MEDKLLTGRWYSTEEVAQLLGLDSSTLRRWRTARPAQGPAFVKLTNRVTMYNSHDVEEWLQRKRIAPEEAA